MDIVTAVVIVGLLIGLTVRLGAIVGYYLTAAFIVARTGSATGITDLGHGAAHILRALFSRGDTNSD